MSEGFPNNRGFSPANCPECKCVMLQSNDPGVFICNGCYKAGRDRNRFVLRHSKWIHEPRKPSYKRAVQWIANNDETAETSPQELASLVSVLLVADMWNKEPEDVAADVLRARAK